MITPVNSTCVCVCVCVWDGLWAILAKIGCPAKFVNIIRSFHDGRLARVIDGGDISAAFSVTSGTKQGCVLALLLFSILFLMLLYVAFHDCNNVIPLTYRTDRNFFDLRKLQAKNMAHNTTTRELLFANDCALAAHTIQEAQHLLDLFVAATCRFGLSISLKKTEIMFQPQPHSSYLPPAATVNSVQVPVAEMFCYLGSRVTCKNTLDDELTARLAKAGAAFGQLSRRLWKDYRIRFDTKIQVYRAAILSSLLYDSETWTPYRRHIKKLDNFHINCLRRISNTKWQDRLSNTEILDCCNITGIEAMLMLSQLRWCGHVHRMPDSRIPKQLLYGQLTGSTRSQGGQRKLYKDYLRLTLKSCDISNLTWDSTASGRAKWRRLCHSSLDKFESQRIANLEDCRARRKDPTSAQKSTVGTFSCEHCGRTFIFVDFFLSNSYCCVLVAHLLPDIGEWKISTLAKDITITEDPQSTLFRKPLLHVAAFVLLWFLRERLIMGLNISFLLILSN